MTKAAVAHAAPPSETIENVVAELFGGERLKVPVRFVKQPDLPDIPDRVVHIRRAAVKELSRVTAFFSAILSRVPRDKLEMTIAFVADLQRARMGQGGSPQDITITPQALLDKWIGEGALILDVFGATIDLLPGFMAIFTDLSSEDGDRLEFDDMALLMMGIVGANYAFFTQRLRPIMKAVIGELLRKREG